MTSKLEKIKTHKTARQFVKFGIVGVSSTAIDWGVHAVLYKGFGGALEHSVNVWLHGVMPALYQSSPDFDGAFTLFKAVSFGIATLNGFYWNRRWTWRIKGKEQRGSQLARFFAVNIIGLLINTLVASQIHKPDGDTANYILALAAATFITMFWNFSGHKFWTFRQKPDPTSEP